MADPRGHLFYVDSYEEKLQVFQSVPLPYPYVSFFKKCYHKLAQNK